MYHVAFVYSSFEALVTFFLRPARSEGVGGALSLNHSCVPSALQPSWPSAGYSLTFGASQGQKIT